MRSVFLVSCVLAVGGCSYVRGVAPENQHLYIAKSNGKWACLNEPSIELLLDQINDDFCDCPDGSDEPGTNACQFTADQPQYFYCENAGHKPAYIENFKLNDGVCDYDICCDGTDEYRSGACPSVCEEVAHQLADHVRKTKGYLGRALDIKKGLKERAHQAREQLEQKARESASQVQSEEKRYKDLVQNLERAKNSGPGEVGPAHLISRELSEHMVSLEQKATALAQALEEKAGLIALLESYLEDLRLNYNPNFNDLAVKRTVNSFADYLSNKLVDQQDPGIDAKDYRVEDILSKIKKLDSVGSHSETVPTFKGLLTHYYSKLVAGGSETKPANHAYNEASESIPEEIKGAQKKLDSLRSEERMYREDLGTNYGDSDILRSVKGLWINKQIGDYNYRLGFLDSIYQDNTLVGRFSGMDGKSMQYSHGTKCWNGPQRSARIDMVCGHSDDLISVSEPEKCQYVFLISSPLACEELTDEDIERAFKVDLAQLQGKH